LSIRVRLRNLIKRRPRPDIGCNATEEEEKKNIKYYNLHCLYNTARMFKLRMILAELVARKRKNATFQGKRTSERPTHKGKVVLMLN
jgi:hypothetical protein